MSGATDERDRVLSEVRAAHPAHILAGLAVLARWAETGARFSANDVRAELRTAGVSGASTGALFNAAIKAGLIRAVGLVESSDPGTHSKPVYRYVRADVPVSTQREAVTVPVGRDRGGRFSNVCDDETPA